MNSALSTTSRLLSHHSKIECYRCIRFSTRTKDLALCRRCTTIVLSVLFKLVIVDPSRWLRNPTAFEFVALLAATAEAALDWRGLVGYSRSRSAVLTSLAVLLAGR